jgi:hypothetical protein
MMKNWIFFIVMISQIVLTSCQKTATNNNNSNNDLNTSEQKETIENQTRDNKKISINGPEGSFAAAIDKAKIYPTLETFVKEYIEINCGEVSREAKDYPSEIGVCPGNYIMQVCGKQIINENCILLLITYGCNENQATGFYFYDVKNQKLKVGFNPKLKGEMTTPKSTINISGKFSNGNILEFITEKDNSTQKTKETVKKYSFDTTSCEFRWLEK